MTSTDPAGHRGDPHPQIPAVLEQMDHERRVPLPIIHTMCAAGLFRVGGGARDGCPVSQPVS